MALPRLTRPRRCVVIVWRRRRVHRGDEAPKLRTGGAASQGRQGGDGGRRAGRIEKRAENDEIGDDLILSPPGRPGGHSGGNDDMEVDADEGCDSEDSSASEYDGDLFEPADPLALDAVFAPVVQSLADEALGHFLSAATTTTSSASSSCSHESQHHHHHHHPHDTPPPMPPPAPTYTCPFYVRDPAAHAACRPRPGLFPRLLDLRRHLQTAHRRPPWCPACGARFARAAARDAHVRAFACITITTGGASSSSSSSSSSPAPMPMPPLPPPGLAEPQLRRLARRPDPAAPAARQWAALWRLCFGDDEGKPPPSPAAVDDVVVARARAALEAAVLERMLEKLRRDTGGDGGEATGA